MRKNRIVVGILVMMFVLFCVLVLFSFTVMKGMDSFQAEYSSSSSAKIGVVEIDGVIMKSKNVIKKLHKAAKSKSIKAIIVRVNSPGGAVAPVQEIYEEMRRIDKEKPVYASFGSVAASGGYYIGAAAREIFSNPGTVTGSIGVIMNFVDMSRLYDLAKVKMENIKAGRYKDVGHPSRPMTDEEKDLMNSMVESVHHQFVKDIENNRAKKIKGNLSEIAQGQIFSGEYAKNVGLVDQLGSMWALGRYIMKKHNLGDEPEYTYIKVKKDVSFWEIFESLDKAVSRLKFFTSSESQLMYMKQ